MLATSKPPAAPPRLKSIDVLRGATIMAMILVNAQFSSEDSYRQLAHAAWNGWTFADTIFPTFLFVVGVSLALSTESRLARGEDRSRLFGHALRRSLLLFACGVVIDHLRFPVREFPFVALSQPFHLTGVLQKIAICYFVAFNIYLWAGLRGVVIGIAGLNLLYLGLLFLYPVPGCGPGSLTVDCNFPGYLDEIVLDDFRRENPFDPDGVGGILPAISTALFGAAAGELLRRDRLPRQRLVWLLAGGIALLAAGGLLSMWVPINKQLWTTSFAVFMAGLSATALAGCSLLDGRPLPRWVRPLEIFGLNAIAAFLISRLIENVPRVHIMGWSLHDDVLARIASPANASLLFAIVVLASVYVPIWLLHRRGWYLKL